MCTVVMSMAISRTPMSQTHGNVKVSPRSGSGEWQGLSLVLVCRERHQSQFPSPDDCIQRLLPHRDPSTKIGQLVSDGWCISIRESKQPVRSWHLCIVSSFPDVQSDQVQSRAGNGTSQFFFLDKNLTVTLAWNLLSRSGQP